MPLAITKAQLRVAGLAHELQQQFAQLQVISL